MEEERQHIFRKQEKKKKKKLGKKSKHKKHHKRQNESSSASGSGEEEAWTEKVVESESSTASFLKPEEPKRDDWMTLPPSLIPTISSEDYKAERRKNRQGKVQDKTLSTIDKPGQHDRELNPYWKEGGCGLPQEENSDKTQDTRLPSQAVGDGGLKWLKKAYRRIHEQAEEEGKSVEEIAAQRWGSLEKLERLIREAEGKSGVSHHRSCENYSSHRSSRGMARPPSDDEDDHRSRHRSEYRHRHSEERSFKASMKKPDSDDEQDYHTARHRIRESSRKQFSRPGDDEEEETHHRHASSSSSHRPYGTSSRPAWMKKEYLEERREKKATPKDDAGSSEQEIPNLLEEQKEKDRKDEAKSSSLLSCSEMNELSAKMLKAEMLGNTELYEKLKDKLERSRQARGSQPDSIGTQNTSVEKEKTEEVKVLTDKEMNALGAKLIKAEMLGNTELVEKLKKQMEEARKARDNAGPVSEIKAGKRREEVVILTKTDSRGFSRPLAEPEDADTGKKKRKVATHDKEGSRVKYFADDDRFSLKKMFEREKLTTAEDHNAEFAELAGKVKGSTNQDYDLDDAVVDVASKYSSSSKQDSRDRLNAILEHKAYSKALEKCRYCLDSSEMKKHLIIAIGLKTYLCVPPYQSLTEGHCLIVPMNHEMSGTLLDEDVWFEIQVFRKGLTKMFEEMKMDTIFMETAMGFRRHPHMVLECIPVPDDVGELAPMYFKKAILESETEWAHNKKLVDLSKKDIRNSVPKGLPYFSVDFGLQGGFAHVIEDEKDFPFYFGKEIVGGMIDAEPRLWKKTQHEDFNSQRKKVLQLSDWWKPYDWTERVKEKKNE